MREGTRRGVRSRDQGRLPLAPFRRRERLPLASVFLLFAVLGLVGGCAKMRAPGGGPLDETDPFLTRSYPDSGATEVGAIDSLVLVFSEPMKRRTVEESFRMTPAVEFRSIGWEADTLTFLLLAPLDSASTYVGLLGGEAVDRHERKLGKPWVWPFSTGPAIDPGSVRGNVIGSRFRPAGLYVYVWPWEAGPPDTTESYYPPDPLRLGQSGSDGAFAIDYLPVDLPLRICALYDRDGDGSYQPLPDRWACTLEPVVLSDTSGVAEGIELFLAEKEEPGVLEGTVVDSLCLSLDPRAVLRSMRAERDSLLEWLSGEYDARQRGHGNLSEADSLRIEGEMSDFALREEVGLADSLFCAQTIRVELRAGEDSLVAATSGPDFRFADVEPGVYRLSAFRDVDRNSERSEGECVGKFPFALEVLPLRTIDDLLIEIALPAGEMLLRPLPEAADSLGPGGTPEGSGKSQGSGTPEGSDKLRGGSKEGS